MSTCGFVVLLLPLQCATKTVGDECKKNGAFCTCKTGEGMLCKKPPPLLGIVINSVIRTDTNSVRYY